MDAETEAAVIVRRTWTRFFPSARTVVLANTLFGTVLGASLSLISWLVFLDVLKETRCSSQTTTGLCTTHAKRVILWATSASVFTVLYLTSAIGFVAALRRQYNLAYVYAILLTLSFVGTLGIGATTIVLYVLHRVYLGVSLLGVALIYAGLWLWEMAACITAYRLARTHQEPLARSDPFVLSASPPPSADSPPLFANSSLLARIERALAWDVNWIDSVLGLNDEAARTHVPPARYIELSGMMESAPPVATSNARRSRSAAPHGPTSTASPHSHTRYPLSSSTIRRSASTPPRSASMTPRPTSTPPRPTSTISRSTSTISRSTSGTANPSLKRSISATWPHTTPPDFVRTHKRTSPRQGPDILRPIQMRSPRTQVRGKKEAPEEEVVIEMDAVMEDAEGEMFEENRKGKERGMDLAMENIEGEMAEEEREPERGMDVVVEDVQAEIDAEKEMEMGGEEKERRASGLSMGTISGGLMRAVLAVRESMFGDGIEVEEKATEEEGRTEVPEKRVTDKGETKNGEFGRGPLGVLLRPTQEWRRTL